MHGYRFLISAFYLYPLKTIRIRILSVQMLLTAIRILSVSMVLLWYNYTASHFNIGCQILTVFGTGIPDLTQHQMMAFHFQPHLTHSSALPEKQKTCTKIACPIAHSQRDSTGSIEPLQPELRPTMVAIIRTWKGSRVVLNCCIERVSHVYCILQCSNYQGGRGRG